MWGAIVTQAVINAKLLQATRGECVFVSLCKCMIMLLCYVDIQVFAKLHDSVIIGILVNF